MMLKIAKSDLRKDIFTVEGDPMSRGPWTWWLWLFILADGKSKGNPRQATVVWTTKNVQSTSPGGKVTFSKGGECTKGAVASWYFDGKTMQENVVLEKCDVDVSPGGIRSGGTVPTSLLPINGGYEVRIGDDFRLAARESKSPLAEPLHTTYTPIPGKGISEIKANRMEAAGTIRGESVKGSAYFQRVFADSPLIPWNWGVFHFSNGGILTYGNYVVLGKSFNESLQFYDGKKMREFGGMSVRMTGKDLPVFRLEGENEKEKIAVRISSYAKSSWEFKEKVLFVIPEGVTYRQYLCRIDSIELTDRKSGKRVDMKGLGRGAGNVEHATGFLP